MKKNRNKDREICMMDLPPGLTDEELENLTERRFRKLVDRSIRKGDMEAWLLLKANYPQFMDRYMGKEK
ncbi:MAG: hypothetical protein IKT57_09810 [Clostridia bacterium]|nr:hypothetical protein [Clostridia bacterium]